MSKKDLSVQSLKEEKYKYIFLNSYLKLKLNLKNLKKKIFVVAVSGGPDSLALVALMNKLKKDKGLKIFYVLVDHQIRKNSSREAILVKRLLKKKEITLTIIKNKEKNRKKHSRQS